jgi:hypothetical protein
MNDYDAVVIMSGPTAITGAPFGNNNLLSQNPLDALVGALANSSIGSGSSSFSPPRFMQPTIMPHVAMGPSSNNTQYATYSKSVSYEYEDGKLVNKHVNEVYGGSPGSVKIQRRLNGIPFGSNYPTTRKFNPLSRGTSPHQGVGSSESDDDSDDSDIDEAWIEKAVSGGRKAVTKRSRKPTMKIFQKNKTGPTVELLEENDEDSQDDLSNLSDLRDLPAAGSLPALGYSPENSSLIDSLIKQKRTSTDSEYPPIPLVQRVIPEVEKNEKDTKVAACVNLPEEEDEMPAQNTRLHRTPLRKLREEELLEPTAGGWDPLTADDLDDM